jgi:hypothetical protein
MRIILLFFTVPFCVFGVVSKVPTELYSGWGKNDHHPGSAPLITDLTFRSICNHIIDQGTEWFDPDKVQQGDLIYLNLWYINWFHREVHDRIKHPYILVTCDVGDWHPDPVLQKLFYDPKLTAWFCRNIIFSYHPKIFQIPMGQSDRYFGDIWLPNLKELSDQGTFEKKHFLYMNFLPRAYGDRNKIVKLFEKAPYCFSRNQSDQQYSSIGKPDYYQELAESTFTLSPVGLEMDCVRTWEALALDCIPVVEHSFLDPVFDELPVLFVHNWTDINEAFLQEQYELLSKRKRDRAFFGFWQNKILSLQAKIRANDLSTGELEATQLHPEELDDLLYVLQEEGDSNPFLICKGFLTAVHSLQIARAAPFLSRIYLSDFWLYEEAFEHFQFKDLTLEKEKSKITLISEKELHETFLNYNPFGFSPSPVFIDLSYLRTTLLDNFIDREKQTSNFRHNLKNDLYHLCQKAAPGVLILGNGGNHTYVSEVLDQLEKQHGLQVGRKGNIWFFRAGS